jgi:polysaccharide biosynthesis protein PslG
MMLDRTLATLVLGASVYVAAVVAIFIHVSHEHASRLNVAPRPAKTCPGPLLGVNGTLAYVKNPQYRSATVVADHRLLGAQVVRDSLLWDQIEPQPGRFDWTLTDAFIARLAQAGIEPVLDIMGSPSWANGKAANVPSHELFIPPQGPAFDAWVRDYAAFVMAAVKRYHGVVHRWEIWNEPNKDAFWRPKADPAAYARLFEALRAAILQVDPEAQVAVGGLSDLTVAPPKGIAGLAFLRALTDTHPTIEYVAIHPYPSASQAPDVHVRGADNFDDIAAVHAQLDRTGYHVPLWVTEWGWPTNIIGTARQAKYVERSISMIEQRYPYVRLATYFTAHDQPPQFLDGLLTTTLQPKPAAQPFHAAASRLAAQCAAAQP